MKKIMNAADQLVWGPVLLSFLLGTGLFLMIWLRFLPVRMLPSALKCVLGAGEGKKGKETVSPFGALMNELAVTIGTGNIVGVATAMVLGGPGALLWMMLSALIGMATKLTESMLAVKYRVVMPNGEFVGGPMYTMERGMKNKRIGKLLALSFSFFAVCAAFGMGNMTQANSISAAFDAAFGIPFHKTGLILTMLVILVVLGGIRGISSLTLFLVPAMGVLYVGASLCIIFLNRAQLPAGIARIVGMAFSPESFGGGVIGTTVVTLADAFRWGIARGVFSNEAGIGAAGISAACADTDDPVRQGYISMTGVFFDTLVICLLTGLTIASSGLLGSVDGTGRTLTGMELMTRIFTDALGERGGWILAVSAALFAFATIAGWAYQGEKVFEYLTGGKKYVLCFRFFYALSTFVGAVSSLELVWMFSDICNGLMAFPNLICILCLSGEAVREIRGWKMRNIMNS